MTEVDKEGVKEQEIAKPDETAEEQLAVQATDEPKEGSKEYNWRRMEQKLQELERKNQELSNTMKAKATAPQEESDELSQLEADDLTTVSQVEKLAEKRAKKIISEELARREREALPSKVRKQYIDYEQVVTNENIEKLVQERPEWETTIKNDPNPYEAAYYLIKQAAFYRENVKNKHNQERIEANSQKPVSSNTLGKQGPLSQANAFATQSKEDLWAEMQRFSKKAAAVPYKR